MLVEINRRWSVRPSEAIKALRFIRVKGVAFSAMQVGEDLSYEDDAESGQHGKPDDTLLHEKLLNVMVGLPVKATTPHRRSLNSGFPSE